MCVLVHATEQAQGQGSVFSCDGLGAEPGCVFWSLQRQQCKLECVRI